jgi:hypothetical protein
VSLTNFPVKYPFPDPDSSSKTFDLQFSLDFVQLMELAQ